MAAIAGASIVQLEQAPEDRTKSRVLVIEDDARLRRIIAMSLTARGHAVREAADVTQGLAALAEAVPDLLILDVNLPDGTGWDVLRRSALPAHVRAVVVTAATVDPRLLAEFHQVACLPKPFSMDALLRLTEGRDGAAR